MRAYADKWDKHVWHRALTVSAKEDEVAGVRMVFSVTCDASSGLCALLSETGAATGEKNFSLPCCAEDSETAGVS